MLLVAAAIEELGQLEGHTVGVGPVVAAATAAALLERLKPDAVILIGTGGAYPGGPKIGTAVVSRKLGLSYGVAAMGLGYVPRPPRPVDANLELLSRLDGVPRYNVLTVGAVTTDNTLATRLSDGWEVEHLEAYSVALACHLAKIPFAAVLGITNRVGPDAHAQWLTNRDAAQEAAREVVRPLFEAAATSDP
jgi:purine-nucleoside phosphorylase